MKEQIVHLLRVETQNDDVWVVGTVEGLVDDNGEPKGYQAHAWNSHLATLKDAASRQRYLAGEILKVAAFDLPRDVVSLAGPVTLTSTLVADALAGKALT
jgi:hypothetical protein